MQRFQSHKIVEAGQITAVDVPSTPDPDAMVSITLRDTEHQVRVTSAKLARWYESARAGGHRHLVGGYLVRYPDGFESWSPAEAFEEGYKPVQPSSGKSAIKGYRELTATEIANMNAVKEHGAKVGDLVEAMSAVEELDQRWISIARTHLQQGFMALTRAIAKPDFF